MCAADEGRAAGEPVVDGAGLRALVGGLGVVVWEADARTAEFTYVSAQAEVLLGFPARNWLGPNGFWASIVHPDDRETSLRYVRRSIAESAGFELSHRAVAADGRVLWLHHKAHVVRTAEGAPARVQGVLLDTSERRANEERERFLGGLEQALQPLEDAEVIMALVARRLGEHVGADRCAYARVESDDDHFLMSGDYATGLPHLPGRFAMREFGAGCLRAMRAGEPWVVDDSRHDERLEAADLAAYEVTGIRAVICVPLHKAGRFVAAMAVHQATPRRWTRAEIDLVAVVVNRCWESLQRTHAGRALRDSEDRYRLLIERATDGIWVLDHDLLFVEVNPAACTLLGTSRAALLGRSFAELVAAEHHDRLRELVADLTTARVMTEVWELRRADGTLVPLELSVQTTPTGLQAIGRDVTERRRAEAERELRLRREHEIVEALQHSLLPRQLPALPRLAAAARYLPASADLQTGGDWYEILPLSGTLVALSVGDVVGKGPTAAAVMGQLRSALSGYLLDGHSPAAALERLDAFAKRTPGAIGSTCACLTFDWNSATLRWAAAGHPPPLVVEAGQPRFLPAGGPMLGAHHRPPYRDGTLTLTPGASVVLYTDGLVERRGAPIDTGLARLRKVVGEAHGLGPDALSRAILDELLTDGHEDDVALVVVRYIPEPLRRRVPAVPDEIPALRRQVRAWARTAGLPPDLLDDLQLAIGEAAANAVEHAYPDGPGEFDYAVSRTGDGGIDVEVRDQGRWRTEPADNGHRGRGLRIIRALARHASFEHDDTGTTATFHLAAPSAVPTRPTPTAGKVPPPAGLTVDRPDDPAKPLRLSITGDLDLTSVAEMRDTVLAAISTTGHGHIEIDLTGLAYLSSSGVALLLEAAARAADAGRSMAVIAAEHTPPGRILALSGLHETLGDATVPIRTVAPPDRSR
jgi:anti-anti-sigma factor